jgi:hypothetical protein
MADFLASIRARIGAPPRRIPPADRPYFLARKPVWLPRDDALCEFYRQQEFLLTHGTVTWGALAYADLHAFEPGPCDLPGTVVYVADATVEPAPAWLATVARQYYALRVENLDASDRAYDFLYAENRQPRVMGRALPPDIAGRLPLRATGVMIRRAHLPAGLMVGGVVPLLVHPRTEAVMIVPSRAWPADYARGWRAEPLGYPALSVIDDHVKTTPAGAAILRKMMADENAGRDAYVYFWVAEPTNGFRNQRVNIAFEPRMDPQRHVLSQSQGLKFIIDRTQIDLLAGLIFGRNLPPDLM